MAIEIDNVTVRFGGITAVSGVSLSIKHGEIIAVVGPNGSGKSTLFNCVSGLVSLATGAVRIDDVETKMIGPSARVRMGLARTFQTPRFDPSETVARAVSCGFYPHTKAGIISSMLRWKSSSREEREVHESCAAILDDLGLLSLRNIPLAELSMGQLRLVEVARAMANKPRYLLLDEPAAGLTLDEQQALAAQVRLLSQNGVGVLLVEHNFNLIRQLAENVLVLDRGKPILSGKPADIEKNTDFVDLYLGSTGRKH
ncbi:MULTISPECIES: ATP-binding cassette domain-containing protein [Sinorhizobium]|uniref:ABC transporter ATP-binding protein n=1 Tax=Sinorhizobium TaxID=28105 RepID=UPI000BEA48E1|nr:MULTISPECIES: ATP-binding cassette domain-containing protein [Sinorhizobium]PDT50929.1 ABC transporter [Sinorhizobium sp. NG07B]POH25046.1 ABC transporter [Sinorhizobium americanum]